jgi:hypothetical protein
MALFVNLCVVTDVQVFRYVLNSKAFPNNWQSFAKCGNVSDTLFSLSLLSDGTLLLPLC